MKAHRVVHAFGLADSICVVHVRLPRHDRLDYDVFYFSHHFVRVCSLRVQYFQDGEKRSFVTLLLVTVVSRVLFVVVSVFVLLLGLRPAEAAHHRRMPAPLARRRRGRLHGSYPAPECNYSIAPHPPGSRVRLSSPLAAIQLPSAASWLPSTYSAP